jgi:hypothetical protein
MWFQLGHHIVWDIHVLEEHFGSVCRGQMKEEVE